MHNSPSPLPFCLNLPHAVDAYGKLHYRWKVPNSPVVSDGKRVVFEPVLLQKPPIEYRDVARPPSKALERGFEITQVGNDAYCRKSVVHAKARRNVSYYHAVNGQILRQPPIRIAP